MFKIKSLLFFVFLVVIGGKVSAHEVKEVFSQGPTKFSMVSPKGWVSQMPRAEFVWKEQKERNASTIKMFKEANIPASEFMADELPELLPLVFGFTNQPIDYKDKNFIKEFIPVFIGVVVDPSQKYVETPFEIVGALLGNKKVFFDKFKPYITAYNKKDRTSPVTENGVTPTLVIDGIEFYKCMIKTSICEMSATAFTFVGWKDEKVILFSGLSFNEEDEQLMMQAIQSIRFVS